MSHSRRGIALALALGAVLGTASCGGDGDGGPSTEGNEDLFTSGGFQEAVDAVGESAGDDVNVLQIQITQAGADFKLSEDQGVSGLIYTGGELREVEVDVVGPIGPGAEGFPLGEVDPEAIDKIVDGVRSQTGDGDPVVSAITFERANVGGELRWTINTRASDATSSANLVFHAAPDGTLAPGGPASATTGP